MAITEQEINAMPAGAELDTLIAKKVMGRPVPTQEEMRACAERVWAQNPRCQIFNELGGFRAVPRDEEAAEREFAHDLAAFKADCPDYSTDIAFAWLVVEKMQKLGYWCRMETPWIADKSPVDAYWAGFTSHQKSGWNGRPDYWTSADSLPLAICRAALLAMAAQNDDSAI